jgi:hypothetical protein
MTAKRRYVTEVEGANGWTRWIHPMHGSGQRNYRAGCCDSGLVHEAQFRVRKDRCGRFSVVFRVNQRATAARRRGKTVRKEQR